MSSTNKTTNYNLSQFVGTDVPSYLGDYNGDMSKIDKAIGDVANSQGSVEQSVVGLTADVQGLSTQVSGVSTSVQQLQTSVAQIDSGYKQADTALSQRITTNANNIQANTTAIEGINAKLGNTDISDIGDGTITSAIEAISAGTTLVWTNPTPSQPFSGDVNVDLSSYKLVLVIFRNKVNSTYHSSALACKDNKTGCFTIGMSGTNISCNNRAFTASNDKVTFEDTNYFIQGGSQSPNNENLIPEFIYGIK